MSEFLKNDILEYPAIGKTLKYSRGRKISQHCIPIYSDVLLKYPIIFWMRKIHNLESFEFLSLIPALSCFLLGFYQYIRANMRARDITCVSTP